MLHEKVVRAACLLQRNGQYKMIGMVKFYLTFILLILNFVAVLSRIIT